MYRTMKYLVPTLGSMYWTFPVLAVADTDPESTKPKCKKICKNVDKRTELERCIDQCRSQCGPVKNAFVEYTKDMVTMAKSASTGLANNIEYLQKCAPPEIQYAAVAGGGAFGMLLGFRKSMIRKILYGTIGSAAMFGVVYPEDAISYTKQGISLAQKYGQQGYNFMAGNRSPVECPKKKCNAEYPTKKECPKDVKPKECCKPKPKPCCPKKPQADDCPPKDIKPMDCPPAEYKYEVQPLIPESACPKSECKL